MPESACTGHLLYFPTLNMKRFLLTMMLVLATVSADGNEVRSKVWDSMVPTTDGKNIRVTFHQPVGKDGAVIDADAVILVHELGGTKDDWGTLPKALSDAGFAVVAIQLRGHGDREKVRDHWTRFEREEFNAMVLDILATRKFLRKQKKVHIRNIGVVGARLGANLALRALKEEAGLKGCYALSPGLNYRGVKVPADLEGIKDRPLKFVVSAEDKYGHESCRAFAENGASVTVKEADKDDLDVGIELLRSHKDLSTDIVNWMKQAF